MMGAMSRSVVLLVVWCCAGGCTDSLVLGPSRHAIDPGGALRRVVTVDGGAVECWVARSPAARAAEPEAFVLFFPGTRSRAEPWTRVVADGWGGRPVEVWGVNYPGAGGSDGPPRLARVGPNARGVYDAVRRVAGDRPVFVQAASFGTAAALGLAARRPVAGLVLWNPPPLPQLFVAHYGWWNLWLLALPAALTLPGDLDSLANAPRVRAPAVFVLSGDDRVVPPCYQRRVVAAYAGPKRTIPLPGADHGSPLTHEAAVRLNEELGRLWQVAVPGPAVSRAAPPGDSGP